jgi:hypothetical protein
LSQRTLEAIFGTLRCCPAYGLRAELGAAIDIALQTLARVSVERSVRGSTGGSQNIVSKSNRQRPFAVVSAWQECQPLTTAPGALSHRPGSRYTRQTGLSFTCSRCATVTTHAAGHNQRVASPVPAPALSHQLGIASMSDNGRWRPAPAAHLCAVHFRQSLSSCLTSP